jgi:hypothetical protein
VDKGIPVVNVETRYSIVVGEISCKMGEISCLDDLMLLDFDVEPDEKEEEHALLLGTSTELESHKRGSQFDETIAQGLGDHETAPSCKIEPKNPQSNSFNALNSPERTELIYQPQPSITRVLKQHIKNEFALMMGHNSYEERKASYREIPAQCSVQEDKITNSN